MLSNISKGLLVTGLFATALTSFAVDEPSTETTGRSSNFEQYQQIIKDASIPSDENNEADAL